MQQSPALLVVDNTLCVRLHVCMPPTVGIFIKSQNKFQWLRLIYAFTDTVASVFFFPLCLHRLKPSVPFQLLSDTNKMSVEYLLQQQTTFSLLLVCNCVLSFSSAPISWGRMSLSLCSLLAFSGKSLNWLSVSVFTSAPSQTPVVGSLNPQEMALFGSIQPLLY